MIIFINISLLILSIVLATGRNLLSKSISRFAFGKKDFFLLQAFIFLAGALVLTPLGAAAAAPLTLLYALIYGVLLILAQWCYTAALESGKLSLCATVYSLGFILPTLSGMLFFNEDITLVKILGVILVLPAIVLSGGKKKDTDTKNGGYMIPLVLAMFASGGLGIMQKVQANSPFVEQKGTFVLVSFVVAGIISLACAIVKGGERSITKTAAISSAGIGVCFAVCNLLNTHLAHELDSAVFYPTLHIGMTLLSLAMSILIFKEKFTQRHAFVLAFAFSGMILVNLPV